MHVCRVTVRDGGIPPEWNGDSTVYRSSTKTIKHQDVQKLYIIIDNTGILTSWQCKCGATSWSYALLGLPFYSGPAWPSRFIIPR